MKLWIFSDLHLDFARSTHPFELPDEWPEYDACVIAGDIRENPVRAIKWIADSGLAASKPVLVVGGNHEPYGENIDTSRVKAAEEAALHPNIHLLQDSHVDIGEVRFLGATLWTDYCLYGVPMSWACYTAASAGMNDHRRIRVARNGYAKWRTKDAYEEHLRSRQYLEAMLDARPMPVPCRSCGGTGFQNARHGSMQYSCRSCVGSGAVQRPIVVVTHHAPSMKSVDPKYGETPLNAAYASNLDHLVDRADLWIHGHVHTAFDYRIGDGRVVCNPRGYVGAGEETGFNPKLVVEVEPKDYRGKQRDDLIHLAQDNA